MRTNKLGGLLRTYGGWDVLKNKVFPSLGIVSQSMAMNFYSQGEITTRIFFGWNMSSELEHRGKPSLSLRQGNVPTIILFASLCHFWRHAQGKNGKIPKSQAWLGYFTSAHLGRRPCIQIGGAVCGSTCPLHIFHSCLSCLSYLHEEHWKRRFAFKKIGRTAGWKPCECRHFHAFAVELNVSMACWEQNRLNTRQVRATLQDGCILHGNMREFGDTGGSPRRRCLFMSFPLNRSLIAVYPGTILSGDGLSCGRPPRWVAVNHYPYDMSKIWLQSHLQSNLSYWDWNEMIDSTLIPCQANFVSSGSICWGLVGCLMASYASFHSRSLFAKTLSWCHFAASSSSASSF